MKNISAFSLKALAFVLCLSATIFSSCKKHDNSIPTPSMDGYPVILDTDIGSSTDDLFALDIIYKSMYSQDIDLKAVMVNRQGWENAAWVDIMNTYYGYSYIPIGVVKNGVENPPVFIPYWQMADTVAYPEAPRCKRTRSNTELENLPDAAILYREILSKAEDESVNIVSIGFCTNLAHLLMTEPDKYSELNGIDLVKKKVKALYVQGGYFSNETEADYNFLQDQDNARLLIREWPTPFYFSPQEVGALIRYEDDAVCKDLNDAGLYNSPIYKVYSYYGSDAGQKMWDAMCVLQLVRPEMFDLVLYHSIEFDENMIMHVSDSGNGTFYFQKPFTTDEEVQNALNVVRQYATTPPQVAK